MRKKVEQQNDKQTGRYNCLPQITEFIDIANLLPKDFIDLPNSEYIWQLAREKYGVKNGTGEILVKDSHFIMIYSEILPALHQHQQIIDYIYEEEDAGIVQRRIADLHTIAHTVLRIAQLNSDYFLNKEQSPFDSAKDFINQYRLDFPDEHIEATGYLFIDEAGNLKAKFNDLISLITTSDIQADRIRECLVCEQIFWAKRSDLRTCSKKCGVVWRQRKYREKDLTAYNEQRRLNYAYKKSIENTQAKRRKS